MPRQCITELDKRHTVQTLPCTYLEPQICSAFVTCCKHDGIKFAVLPAFELNFVSNDLRYPLEHLSRKYFCTIFGKKFSTYLSTLTRTYLKGIVPIP